MQLLRQFLRTDTLCRGHQFGPAFERQHSVREVAGDAIETDTAQPHGRLVFASRLGDQEDRTFAVEQRTGPGGVLPAKAYIQAPRQMRRLEEWRFPHIQKLRAFPLKPQHRIERERLQRLFEHPIERGPFLCVQHGIVREIGGRIGLVGSHHADKLTLTHWLQGVIHVPLDTDG